MISLSIFVTLALVPFTFAQSDAATQIEAIEAHFSAAQLVPNLLATFAPSAYITPSFEGAGDAAPGAKLSQAQVKPAPSLSLTPANSTVKFDGKYTLAMVDAGPVGSDESKGQTRHMLINSVTVSSNSVSTNGGVAVTAYAGPAPPAGSGPHRYVILLYTQPDNFSPPQDLSSAGAGVAVFDFADYVKSTNLGPLVAANYFTVEEGTASASLPATSAVVTSTLSPVSSGTATSAGTAQSTTASSDASTLTGSFAMVLLAPLVAFMV